jgi:hypothetical protein
MSTVFVASLSEAEDDLFQWSMYAGFGGVATGFDAAALAALDRADHTRQAIGFFRVTYDDASADAFWDWFVSRWQREAAIAIGRDISRTVDPLWQVASWFGNLAMAALTVLPRMKSSHFAGEREWRLAHAHFPEHEECLVHTPPPFKTHVELDLSQLAGRMPLTSLWLGPAVANDESARLTGRFLAQHGYADVPVKCSRIPLRGEPQQLEL